jgi:N-acetylglucosamine kinase-like BadF-type ATPase
VLFRQRTPNEPLTRYEVATFCPFVVEAAQQGDWKAVDILKEAGCELGRLATAVIERLGMQDDEFAVVPFGGVFRAGELVLASFRETVLAVAPGALVIRPRFEPAVGAVLLALDELGVEINPPILDGIERSSASFPECRAQ